MNNNRYIQSLSDPNTVLLTWQNSEYTEGQFHPRRGRRFIVGQLRRNGDETSFEYLHDTVDFEQARSLGFNGYPSLKITNRIHNNVESVFVRRLPDPSRSDFKDYLKYFRISPDSTPSLFFLLAYTGAELPSDGFSFLPLYDPGNYPTEFSLTVAGARHYISSPNSLNAGEKVSFIAEPDNKFDANAVKITSNSQALGYVRKGQAINFFEWVQKYSVSGTIERINGCENDPRILILGEIHPNQRV